MKQQSQIYHLGLELAGEQIRAGVFDGAWRLIGKATRSAKKNRGFEEVLQRMARCALDAVDEADLLPEKIAAMGVLTDYGAQSKPAEFQGEIAREWTPEMLNQLAAHLPISLNSHLVVGKLHPTLLWTVHELELAGQPNRMLGVFADSTTEYRYADRFDPGEARVIHPDLPPEAVESAMSEDRAFDPTALLSIVRQTHAEALLLVGKPFRDDKLPVMKRIREALKNAGLELAVYIPVAGEFAGAWAGARLAAKTFG